MASLSKNINTSSCSDEDDVVDDLRRGPWTLEEDTLLLNYIAWHGEGRWNLLAKRAGLRRTGKSCRLRWLNYLKPDVKRGNLTPQEQVLILDLHSKWGNRWSKIAQHLPGRTDNEIKNYWRTRVQKQARHLNIDPNSTAFQDIIRCFWIPRLVQKIQNSAPNSSASILLSQNPTNIPHHQPISNILTPPPPPPLPVAQNLEVPRIQILEQNDQNSDSDHCASSCISSNSTDQSMNISDQLSHFSSEVPCYVDNNCYDMEAINLVGLDGGFGNPGPASNCHVAESNCGIYGFGDTEWNTDELWQFRNLHER